MIRIILASASPRRIQLLQQIGYTCEVIPSGCDETVTLIDPESVVRELSFRKAEYIARSIKDEAVVIGADTVVSFDGQILGKPVDESDAYRMLRLLSGHIHQVFTGVSIIRIRSGQRKSLSFTERTDVCVGSMSDEEILEYIATKDPMDKAGAYGIQGSFARFVTSINGDYNNVVGLPAARVYHELKKLI